MLRNQLHLLVICALACTHSVADAATLNFSDSEFAPPNWIVTRIGDGIITRTSVGSGGNPGPHLQVTHQNATIDQFGFNYRVLFAYRPDVSGPVTTINWSIDQIAIQNLNEMGIGVLPALRQGANHYFVDHPFFVNSDFTWTTFNLTGLTADDFRTVSDPNAHPDFSAAGQLFQPGFATFVQGGSGGAAQIAGFDNWTFTVNPVPEPGTIGLIACGVASALFLRMRRR